MRTSFRKRVVDLIEDARAACPFPPVIPDGAGYGPKSSVSDLRSAILAVVTVARPRSATIAAMFPIVFTMAPAVFLPGSRRFHLHAASATVLSARRFSAENEHRTECDGH